MTDGPLSKQTPIESILQIAKAKDALAIVNLVNSAYRGESSRIGWTTEADLLDGQRVDLIGIEELIKKQNTYILLLKQNDLLLGCVLLEKKNQTCYLGMLTISPSKQNQSLGKIILKKAEDFALDKLQCQIIEMTVISKRKELLNFYYRRGYQLTGEKRPFPYGDERFGIPKVNDLEFVVLKKNL